MIGELHNLLTTTMMMNAFLLLTMTLISVQSYTFITSKIQFSPKFLLFSTKTPLVANGKRFDADPGTSMLAVSNLCLQLASQLSHIDALQRHVKCWD
jgi:hypothetical protein